MEAKTKSKLLDYWFHIALYLIVVLFNETVNGNGYLDFWDGVIYFVIGIPLVIIFKRLWES